jgi:hypothetical protein
MRKRFLLSVIISSIVVACSMSTAPEITHFGSGPRRILFLGNSLTDFNAMPATTTSS